MKIKDITKSKKEMEIFQKYFISREEKPRYTIEEFELIMNTLDYKFFRINFIYEKNIEKFIIIPINNLLEKIYKLWEKHK